MFVEKEIKKYLVKFIENHNIPNIDYNMINSYMKTVNESRKIKLIKDTFLSVCEYLDMHNIICFIVTCTDFMKYYPNIWGIIQKQLYPNSTILKSDYKCIIKNISLVKYAKDIIYLDHEILSNIYCYEIDEQESCCISEGLPSDIEDVLTIYKHNSLLDKNGNLFHTVKPNVYSKLYGM